MFEEKIQKFAEIVYKQKILEELGLKKVEGEKETIKVPLYTSAEIEVFLLALKNALAFSHLDKEKFTNWEKNLIEWYSKGNSFEVNEIINKEEMLKWYKENKYQYENFILCLMLKNDKKDKKEDKNAIWKAVPLKEIEFYQEYNTKSEYFINSIAVIDEGDKNKLSEKVKNILTNDIKRITNVEVPFILSPNNINSLLFAKVFNKAFYSNVQYSDDTKILQEDISVKGVKFIFYSFLYYLTLPGYGKKIEISINDVFIAYDELKRALNNGGIINTKLFLNYIYTALLLELPKLKIDQNSNMDAFSQGTLIPLKEVLRKEIASYKVKYPKGIGVIHKGMDYNPCEMKNILSEQLIAYESKEFDTGYPPNLFPMLKLFAYEKIPSKDDFIYCFTRDHIKKSEYTGIIEYPLIHFLIEKKKNEAYIHKEDCNEIKKGIARCHYYEEGDFEDIEAYEDKLKSLGPNRAASRDMINCPKGDDLAINFSTRNNIINSKVSYLNCNDIIYNYAEIEKEISKIFFTNNYSK